MRRRRSATPSPLPPPPPPPRDASPAPPGAACPDPPRPVCPAPLAPAPPPPAPASRSAAPKPARPVPPPLPPGIRNSPRAAGWRWDGAGAGSTPAADAGESARDPSGPARGRSDRAAPSPGGPAGVPDPPLSPREPDGTLDATGGPAISRTASGGGVGCAGGDSAALWLTDGEEPVGAFAALARGAGIAGESADVAGARLSGGDAAIVLTTVTRRARNVAVGLVAVATRRTSPPRSSAWNRPDATTQRGHCPLGCRPFRVRPRCMSCPCQQSAFGSQPPAEGLAES
jgi:hypothetical protein